jgi:hypothetical protein
MADGYRVTQLTLNGDDSDSYTFAQLLDLLKPVAAATTTFDVTYWTRTDEYWDGVEALWTRDPATGTLYIRFRNGDDPNSKEIKISSNGGQVPGRAVGYAIGVSADWNVIEKLHVKGANVAILINTLADNNRIQDNKVEGGQYGIMIAQGANAVDNHILRNNVFANMWGDTHGDYGQWGGYATPVTNTEFVRSRRYFFPKKYEYSTTPSMLELNGSGSGTVAAFNYVHDATVAVGMGYETVNPMHTGMIVASNLLSHMASVGISLGSGQTAFQVFANTITNSNIGIRYQNLNYNNASGNAPNGFIYRNTLVNANNFGAYGYWGYASGGTRIPLITNYHNTFSGGYYGLQISKKEFIAFNGLSGYRWHNNIWSCANGFGIDSEIAADADTFAAFTHNIVRDTTVNYPFWGAGNQQITSLYWPLGTWPELAGTETAIDSGVVLTGYPDIISDTLPDKGSLPFNPEPPLPLVSLSSSASQVNEAGLPITIYITRTGSTAGALTGSWTISSGNGVQFSTISLAWQIDAGQSVENVTLTPLDDGGYTGPLSFVFALVDEAGYDVVGSDLTITWKDGDVNPVALRGPYFPGQSRPPF